MNVETFAAEIILRKAVSEDCRSIFLWRNAHDTRKHSSNSNVIEWDDHQKWFSHTLQNKDRLLLIGEIENKPIGVLRFDLENNQAVINIYLVPGLYGNGLGTRLLQAGMDWLCITIPDINKIVANVKPENIPSKKMFERAGYKECEITYEYDI